MESALVQANFVYMNYEMHPEHFQQQEYHHERENELWTVVRNLYQQSGITLDLPSSSVPDEIYRLSRLQAIHYYTASLLSKRRLSNTENPDRELVRDLCMNAISALREVRTVRLINQNILEQFRTLYLEIYHSI